MGMAAPSRMAGHDGAVMPQVNGEERRRLQLLPGNRYKVLHRVRQADRGRPSSAQSAESRNELSFVRADASGQGMASLTCDYCKSIYIPVGRRGRKRTG